MTPERLVEIREQANNRWLHGFDPGTVRELLDHSAQLEAQRGELARELDLAKREAWTAKERHKDEKDRADGLRERLDELSAEEFAKAQRGGAVVVPEMPEIERAAILSMARDAYTRNGDTELVCEQVIGDTLGWVKARTKTISPNRVMADGVVGVDREYLRFLEDATTCNPWPNCKTCELGCIAYEKGNGCSWWRINKTKRDALGAQTVEAK